MCFDIKINIAVKVQMVQVFVAYLEGLTIYKWQLVNPWHMHKRVTVVGLCISVCYHFNYYALHLQVESKVLSLLWHIQQMKLSLLSKRLYSKVMAVLVDHLGLHRFMMNPQCTKVTVIASFQPQQCIDLAILH